MAYNNQTGPFWDFVRSLDTGRTEGPHEFEGYEHPPPPPPHSGPPPFPFGGFDRFGHPGPFGRHGPFGGFGDPGSFGGPGPHGSHHGGPRGRFGRRGGRREHSPHGSRSRSPHPERSGSPHGGPREEGFEDHPHPRGPPPFGPHHGPRHGHGPRGPPRHSRCFEDESSDEHPHPRGPPPPFGPHHGPGPRGPHGRGRGGFGGRGGHRGPPPFGGPAEAPFDLSALLGTLASHPIAQAFQTFTQQGFRGEGATRSEETPVADDESENTFTPPVDTFSTLSAYVLHAAIPGAKKEDVGVNWDAEKSELNIAGVVYRQGDEDFLKSLSKAERKVGVFERSIKLPLGDDKEEIDGDAIVAKLEDGVLVVTVPKVEKEWTEVKKIDIN